jgi:serine/threonine-protein kinase
MGLKWRAAASNVLNMSGRNPESVLFGPYRFVAGDGLWCEGRAVALPPRALGVLTTLLATPGEVVTKQQLMDAVWPDTFVTESSLLEAIGLLRETFGDNPKQPRYIQTVHRRGYRFIAAIEAIAAGDASDPREAGDARDARDTGSGGLDRRAAWRPALIGVAASIITMAVAVTVWISRQPTTERRSSRFSISLPNDATLDPMHGSVAVSLDGSRLVYVATVAGRSQLFVRSVDQDAPFAIDRTEDATDPFFSPDGEWIGFFARGSLQKVRVDGGTPVILCAARAGAGATWTADNTIVFGGGPGGGLARVSAFANSSTIGAPADTHRSAGAPVVIATPTEGSREVRLGWPDVLPGERGVLYTSVTLAGSDVGVIDLRTGRRTLIAEHAAFARYLPSGHVVFERQGRLEAARFSLATLAVTAAPTPIVSGVSRGAMFEGPRFAFSRSGAMLVYVPATIDEQEAPLHWLDARGQLERVPLPPPRAGSIDIAPNQHQLALTMDGESGPSLWVGDTARGDLRRFINDGQSVSPAWRPDGREIAFAFSKAGPFNLFAKPVDGDATAAALSVSPWNQFPTSWAPDASELAFTEFQPLTGADIWVLDVKTRQRRAVVRTLFDETWARFSPDGRWIAYMSNESGRWEVYVRPSSGDGSRLRVSTLGGVWPCWSPDGRTLYFSANGRTMAAALDTSTGLSASVPMNVPGADAMVLAGGATAGDRLLVRQAATQTLGRAELRVVLEWFSELTRHQS